MNNHWQLQEAKNKFSYVVKQATEQGPQFITVHGKPSAVLLSVEEYQSITRPDNKLSEFLMESPLHYGEIEPARSMETPREVDL
jgi:prevent-host-death family protein